MKKLFLLILPLLALSFNACDKNNDDGGGDETNNVFTINGKSYELSVGIMEYFGETDANTANVDLILETDRNDTNGINFEMFIPKNEKKLVAGTYTLKTDASSMSYSDSSFAWTDGDPNEDESGNYFSATGGTVTVAVSGNTYTITVNCTLEGGGTVKGTYKGALSWADHSEN